MCNGIPGHKIKVKSGTMVLQSPDTEEILRSFIPEPATMESPSRPGWFVSRCLNALYGGLTW